MNFFSQRHRGVWLVFCLSLFLFGAAGGRRSSCQVNEFAPPTPTPQELAIPSRRDIREEATQLEEHLEALIRQCSDPEYMDQVASHEARMNIRTMVFDRVVRFGGYTQSDDVISYLVCFLESDYPTRQPFTAGILDFPQYFTISPCRYALSEIGMPAVPALIDVLKGEFDERDVIEPYASSRRSFALWTLLDIYHQGGHAQAMLELRLQIEIDNTEGESREHLQSALASLQAIQYTPPDHLTEHQMP